MRDKDTKILEEKYKNVTERRQNYDETFTTIKIYDDKADQEVPVELSIEYDKEPTEYVGGHKFWQGGVDIQSIKTTDDINIGGKEYPAGTDVEMLYPYMDWWVDDASEEYIAKWTQKFMDDMKDIASNGGENIPTQHYHDIYR